MQRCWRALQRSRSENLHWASRGCSRTVSLWALAGGVERRGCLILAPSVGAGLVDAVRDLVRLAEGAAPSPPSPCPMSQGNRDPWEEGGDA